MIECKCVIQVINYVLDRSDFKEQIVRTIPKVENTFEHKYNQIERLQEVILPEHHHKGLITEVWDYKNPRSEGCYQLKSTQEVDIRR